MSKLNQKIVKTFCRDYKNGLSSTAIGKLYGFPSTTVKRILNRNGIQLRTLSAASSWMSINPFKDLSSDEVQYWLGYIASDGSISKPGPKYRVNISTNENKGLHLEKYAKFLGNIYKVHQYWNKNYSCWEYSLNFCNKEIHTYLCSLGLVPQKSLILEMNIPLTWGFVRGVLDGDGTVVIANKSSTSKGRPRIGFATGSIKFKNQLLKFLSNCGLHPTITVQHAGEGRLNPLYSINICRFNEIKKIYYFLYNNATVFLERKQLKFGLNLQECKKEITL